MILLKPDAVGSDGIRADVEKLIQDTNLEIVDRRVVTLCCEDVLDVWPRFATEKFPISRELNTLYMTSGESECMLISGPRAAAKAVSIRNQIRRAYRAAPFANFLHAPTDSVELLSNVNKFFGTDRNPGRFVRHSDDSEPVGIWGKLADEDKEKSVIAARQIWAKVQQGGWSSLWREPVVGKWVLQLKRGALQSIDFGMSALSELIPEWYPDAVVSVYLEAEHRGEVALLSGTANGMRTLCWRAADLGLLARVKNTSKSHSWS